MGTAYEQRLHRGEELNFQSTFEKILKSSVIRDSQMTYHFTHIKSAKIKMTNLMMY